MRILFRDYQVADLEACLAVFDSNMPKYFAASEREEYLEFLNDPDDRQQYLVLEQDKKIVGCGGYYVATNANWGGLSFGMVTRDLHGTGLGKKLLLTRLKRLAEFQEVQEIILDTSQYIFRFFQKLGFEVLQITPNGYGNRMDRYDMRLFLNVSTRVHIQTAYQEVFA